MKILCMGSVNIDKTYQVDHIPQAGETISACGFRQGWGGKGLNQAVSAAKSWEQVYFAGNANKVDIELRDFLAMHNIHVDYLRFLDTEPTGSALINVDRTGQNCIVVHGGANLKFTETYIDWVLAGFAAGDVLLLQNEINDLGYIITQAKKRGVKVAINLSPFEDALKELPLELVDLFLINEVEGFQLTGCQEPEEILEKIQRMYPDAEVVLTLGCNGSVYRKGDLTVYQPIYPVNAVDTTAAGDTFTGYFLSGMALGLAPKESMDRAARASAIAVSRAGATDSIPTLEEVLDFC